MRAGKTHTHTHSKTETTGDPRDGAQGQGRTVGCLKDKAKDE
jgi:hypothetical protein